MSNKQSWANKLIKHFGNKPFTTKEAVESMGYKGQMCFSKQKMSGKLLHSPLFKIVGEESKMENGSNRMKSVKLWQVK